VNRAEFLDRVRQAAMKGRAYRVHVEPVADRAGYVGAAGELATALAGEIQSIGGNSQIVDSWDAAREAVLHWLRHYQARSVVCWRHAALDQLGLSDLLASESILMHDHDKLAALPQERKRQIMLDADLGISSADFAVAETGTLAVCASAGQERSMSLVPPVHLAIITQSQIVADLFDLFEKLAERGLPSNVALISGPSKTGDIELELTTGVHGPGFWHVVIVRGA
jgi:L-lactate utilization protein LutC